MEESGGIKIRIENIEGERMIWKIKKWIYGVNEEEIIEKERFEKKIKKFVINGGREWEEKK